MLALPAPAFLALTNLIYSTQPACLCEPSRFTFSILLSLLWPDASSSGTACQTWPPPQQLVKTSVIFTISLCLLVEQVQKQTSQLRPTHSAWLAAAQHLMGWEQHVGCLGEGLPSSQKGQKSRFEILDFFCQEGITSAPFPAELQKLPLISARHRRAEGREEACGASHQQRQLPEVTF